MSSSRRNQFENSRNRYSCADNSLSFLNPPPETFFSSRYHEQFRRAAIERYFKNLNHVEQCHSAMAEYFLGVWGGIPKPYHYTEMQKQRFGVTEHEGLADRKVPKQPNAFGQQRLGPIFWISKSSNWRYNTRKLNELPYHLLRAGRADELLNLCLFNYDFMQAKVP